MKLPAWLKVLLTRSSRKERNMSTINITGNIEKAVITQLRSKAIVDGILAAIYTGPTKEDATAAATDFVNHLTPAQRSHRAHPPAATTLTGFSLPLPNRHRVSPRSWPTQSLMRIRPKSKVRCRPMLTICSTNTVSTMGRIESAQHNRLKLFNQSDYL